MTFRYTLVVVTLLLAGCNQTQEPPQLPPPAVTVAEVVQRDVNAVTEEVGRIEAVERVAVRSRVEGVLQRRLFEEGGDVNAGDTLFEIEPDKFAAAVAVSKASVAEAKAAHHEASQYLKRLSNMSKDTVSELDLEKAVSDELQTRSQLAKARAELRLAELDLSYTKIIAPISGRIGKAAVTEGNLISPETGVLTTLVQLDPIYVSFAISERISTEFLQQESQPELEEFTVFLRLSNYQQYPLSGQVVYLDNEIDANTGTLAMRAKFPNPDKSLIPGQFVTVLGQRRVSEHKLLIPQASVQQDQAGHYVLVVNPSNHVEKRRIVTGERYGTEWAVEAGLQSGELVIYLGIEKVRPDVPVTPTLARVSEAR